MKKNNSINNLNEDKNNQNLEETPLEIYEHLFGIEDHHREWVERLKESDPITYAKIRNLE